MVFKALEMDSDAILMDCREKLLIGECLVNMLVRFYLEERDLQLRRFIAEFQTLKAQVYVLLLFLLNIFVSILITH